MAIKTFNVLVQQLVTVTVDTDLADAKAIADIAECTTRPLLSIEAAAEFLAETEVLGRFAGRLSHVYRPGAEARGFTITAQPLQTELVGD